MVNTPHSTSKLPLLGPLGQSSHHSSSTPSRNGAQESVDRLDTRRDHEIRRVYGTLSRLPEPVSAAAGRAVAAPEGDSINECFLDPISCGVMVDPVYCDDGYTYNISTAQRRAISPYTDMRLNIIGANVGLRRQIWRAHPELRSQYTRPPESSFSGEVDIAGLPKGDGILRYINGTEEEGFFFDGLLTQGTRVDRNGNRESGAFDAGQLDGEGVRVFAAPPNVGETHSGLFVRGQLEEGTIDYSNGDKYSGSCRNGKKNGNGVMLWANGARYSGAWAEDEQDGEGVCVFAVGPNVGETHSGLFVRGQLKEGTIDYPNDDKYSGSCRNGKKNGNGVMLWADGERYSGAWAEDEQDGYGEMFWANGDIYKGAWTRGVRKNYGVFTIPNKFEFSGMWDNDQMNGEGVARWPSGACFSGRFINNKRKKSTSKDTNLSGRLRRMPNFSLDPLDQYSETEDEVEIDD